MALLWMVVNMNKRYKNYLISIGYQVERQFAVYDNNRWFIADLYIRDLNLIIELDDLPSHGSRKERDNIRNTFYKDKGYNLLVITNAETITIEEFIVKFNEKVKWIKK